MRLFTVVYHNFGGYKLEISPYVPVEFVICSTTVLANTAKEAKNNALDLFIEQGHVALKTAIQKYDYQ